MSPTRSLPLVAGLVAAAVVTVVAAAGCEKDNPNACVNGDQRPECTGIDAGIDAPTCPQPPDHCPASTPVCNTGTGSCEGCTVNDDCAAFPTDSICHVPSGACGQCTPTSGQNADGESAQCTAAGLPICDASDHTCRACTKNSECASQVCDLAPGSGTVGSCVPMANVVYMDPAGNTTNACGAAPAPASGACKTLEAAVAQVTATRKYVRMAPGATYLVAEATGGMKIGKPVTIIGNGSILQRVETGSILEVNNGGKVRVEDLTISPSVAAVESNSAECTQAGELALVRVRLTGNQGVDPKGYGVRAANTCKLFVDSSTVDANLAGGIMVSVTGGEVTIVNDFVVDNGSVAGTFGGISVTTPNALQPRIEFNTIAANRSAPGEVDGFICNNPNATFIRNNIIVGTTGKPRVGGTCQHVGTLVSPTCDGTATILQCGMNGNTLVDAASASMLHFVQTATRPFDYHLGAGSIAEGKANNTGIVSGLTDHDVDGDPRVGGGSLEPGADELP